MVTSLLKTLAAKHDSHGVENGGPLQGRRFSRPRTGRAPARGRPHPRGQPEAPSRTVRRHSPRTARERGHHRPRSRPGPLPTRRSSPGSSGTDANCASTAAGVQVHHVARLADLAYPGHGQPAWARLMAAKRRKSLSWSARPATTRSMPNGHQPQSQPRHKSLLESRMPGNWPVPVERSHTEKDPRTAGTSSYGLPNRSSRAGSRRRASSLAASRGS